MLTKSKVPAENGRSIRLSPTCSVTLREAGAYPKSSAPIRHLVSELRVVLGREGDLHRIEVDPVQAGPRRCGQQELTDGSSAAATEDAVARLRGKPLT